MFSQATFRYVLMKTFFKMHVNVKEITIDLITLVPVRPVALPHNIFTIVQFRVRYEDAFLQA